MPHGRLGHGLGRRGGRAGHDRGPAPCSPLPPIAGDAQAGFRVIGFDALATASRDAEFRAQLGLLGDSFAAAKTCIQAIGPGAGLAAATGDGKVAKYSPFQATTLVSDLAQCPVSIVDVGGIGSTDPNPTRHLEKINGIERRIELVMDAMPNGADLVVAGLADRDQQERLRLLTASGPHYGRAARLGLDPPRSGSPSSPTSPRRSSSGEVSSRGPPSAAARSASCPRRTTASPRPRAS